MPVIPMEKIQPVLERLDEFCLQLNLDKKCEKLLRGALQELKIHFLQRTIPRAYCTDLDFIRVEWFDDVAKPVALIEIKKNSRALRKWQQEVYTYIAEKLGIPFYLLEASEDLTQFWVTDTSTNNRVGPITLKDIHLFFGIEFTAPNPLSLDKLEEVTPHE